MNEIEKTLDFARNEGLNCSQAILAGFGKSLGIDLDTAKKLGRLWGGGMGHLADTCGYLTGAILVLAHVFNHADESQARKEGFEANRRLFEQFSARRGTTRCKGLLGADMTTEEGRQRIKEGRLVQQICHGTNGIGQDVAEILFDLIGNQTI